MPRHESDVARFLGKHRGAEQQDVGPDQRLDRIEDVLVARQPDDPGCRHVRLDLELLLRLLAEDRVVAVELCHVARRLRGRNGVERKRIAFATEMLDLRLGQAPGHRLLP
jgi:hypothetical protein